MDPLDRCRNCGVNFLYGLTSARCPLCGEPMLRLVDPFVPTPEQLKRREPFRPDAKPVRHLIAVKEEA